MKTRSAALVLLSACASHGLPHLETPSGADVVCAPAGRPCVFVRPEETKPQQSPGSPSEDPIVTNLWVLDGKGRGRLLTRSREPDPDTGDIGFLAPRDPRFSPDGRHLYVTTDGWSTSAAVQEIDLASGQPSLVIDGTLRSFETEGQTWRLVVERYLLDLDHGIESPGYGGRAAYLFVVDPTTRKAVRMSPAR